MKKLTECFLHTFFRRDMDLRVKLFHVLAITGALICVVMAGICAARGAMSAVLLNVGLGVVTVALLVYSARSGRYQFCYTVSILCIFLIFFPILFLVDGGYYGGMPFFFVFAVVFTVFMLDGWTMLAVTALELIFYTGLCILTYYFPEWVQPFESEQAELADLIVCFVVVSLSLGGALFSQLHLYRRQQRELEMARLEAEAANRAKSAFLANMSHEIRTPIHIVLGMNEIIRRENRTTRVRDCSEKIDEAGGMLLSLVDNVLDVSKIESGKMELLPAAYRTRELADTLMLIGRTRCEKKGLAFQLNVDQDLPPALFGDVTRIKQVAVNLLSNAVKYTRKGGVTVTMAGIPREDPEELTLGISVADTGIGIRQEVIPTLFEAFTRADLAAHRSIEGTGLGLAIVKTLTELMGGVVRVESVFGEGSTFSVELPQRIVAASEEQESALRERTFLAPAARILVVDDNEENRQMMRSLLSDTHIQVDTAESGEDCIQMVRAQTYHLILLDYMMPGMDGEETLRHLQELPDFHVPVVAFTANAMAGTEQRLLEAGFAAFVVKPVPWSRLEKLLAELLPSELVQWGEESAPQDLEEERLQLLTETLRPYGINLEAALGFFRGDLRQCGKTAEIFCRYDGEERRKAEELFHSGDLSNLRFLVHALKGKARNMGIESLGAAAARMETLCTEKNREEAVSLMPYLLYLWKRSADGLAVLARESFSPEERPRQGREGTITPEECRRQLPELLAQLQRKPSLNLLEVLLTAEGQTPGEREKLEQVRQAVTAIDFETAERRWTEYLHEREGTEQ